MFFTYRHADRVMLTASLRAKRSSLMPNSGQIPSPRLLMTAF